MEKTAIIVAAGGGARMKTDVPKQFLIINERPVLMYTIEQFFKNDASMRILLVIPHNHFEYWENLCHQFSFNIPHQCVAGGSERFYSVKNALENLPPDGLVAIHDGVRPFVSQSTIDRCFDVAERLGTAVPVVDSPDSIRQLTENNSFAVDRSQFKMVQTPQVFQNKILLKAYQQSYSTLFTDDASVVEAIGYKIELVEGNRENVKLTTPMDLLIASVLVKNIT